MTLKLEKYVQIVVLKHKPKLVVNFTENMIFIHKIFMSMILSYNFLRGGVSSRIYYC